MAERDALGGLDREERVVRWFAGAGGAVLVVAWRGGGGGGGGNAMREVLCSRWRARDQGECGEEQQQAGKQASK